MRIDAAVRAVLLRCGGLCENPQCTGQPDDVTAAGEPLLEVDHIDPIKEATIIARERQDGTAACIGPRM
jgi:hypothetical protein